MNNYSQAASQLGTAVNHQCKNESEVTLVKKKVQESYTRWAQMVYDKAFMNWGLWDKQTFNEYRNLNFNFGKICSIQDIYSQLLIYYLIRPLVKANLFNKRLLDIGCGNGIGLKVSSELLRTQYALGVDLVDKFISNANKNFYKMDSVNYIQSDAEQLGLDSESFDIITNLESSHLYPKIERFFKEVERVLAPGGFFCYSDINVNSKQQAKILEEFVAARKNLRIVYKHNITKMVQGSIYDRIITQEKTFYKRAYAFFDYDKDKLLRELPSLAGAMGLSFLPWWKIWFKNSELSAMAKNARRDKYWGKKYYFYYLIQKSN